MSNMLEFVQTDSARKSFYPTPESVAEELLKDIDLRQFQYILEPSAGKGDLAKFVVGKRWKVSNRYHWRNPKTGEILTDEGHMPENDREWSEAFRQVDIECIEIDPALRNILEGEGLRVVHDDFLTYETQKRYDLIVMNPPFDAGADHLMKAMDLMQRGGTIACILNAETLRNPYSYKRQELLEKLEEYDAEIRYVENAFADAERQTDVSVALITFEIPAVQVDSTFMDEMRKAPTYKSAKIPPSVADIVRYNAIEEIVNKYNYEVACGIRLIEEYKAMSKLLNEGLGPYDTSVLSVIINGKKDESVSINKYIRATRSKYWNRLFNQPVITEKFTSNLLNELRDNVSKLVDYEFSVYNILTLIIKFNARTITGIEETIIALFDKWTASSWHEDSPNRHYYNGWKTNDCFRIGKKVIVPFYDAFSWGHLNSYRIIEYLEDVEKTLDFLDRGRTEWPDNLRQTIQDAERDHVSKNIETKYFSATFYKKGTCHLAFKNMDLLEKFNLFASQHRGWLPPSYGKKRYAEMTKEEQEVVDSFQGKDKYEEILARRDYYLDTSANEQLLLGGNVA